MTDLELLIQEYVPIKKQYLIRELQEENEMLKEKINDAINFIETKGYETDFSVSAGKVDRVFEILKGTNNE